jgi:hypothetical protein
MATGGSAVTAAEAATIGLDAAFGDCARAGGPKMQATVIVAAQATPFHRHAAQVASRIEVIGFIVIIPVK